MRHYLDFDIFRFYGTQGHTRASGKLPSFNVMLKKDIKEVMDLAQVSPKPSDITILQTGLQYNQFGHEMMKQKIPYKLRISKNPIETHSDSYKKRFWASSRNSLLIKPITISILRLQVKILQCQSGLTNWSGPSQLLV